MGIVERLRGVRDGLAAARSLGRLRGGRRGGAGDGVPIAAAVGPGSAPRRAAPRPSDDPALRTRLTRWRGRDAPRPSADAAMTARERAAAMDDLHALRGRLSGDQAALIDAALAGEAVTVRRLGPEDGHLWEMPGMRVFAIVGVQAFTVRDEPPPGL